MTEHLTDAELIKRLTEHCDMNFTTDCRDEIVQMVARFKALCEEVHDLRISRNHSDLDAKEAQNTAISLKFELQDAKKRLQKIDEWFGNYPIFSATNPATVGQLLGQLRKRGGPHYPPDHGAGKLGTPEQTERMRLALLEIADWPANHFDGDDAARVAKKVLGSDPGADD